MRPCRLVVFAIEIRPILAAHTRRETLTRQEWSCRRESLQKNPWNSSGFLLAAGRGPHPSTSEPFVPMPVQSGGPVFSPSKPPEPLLYRSSPRAPAWHNQRRWPHFFCFARFRIRILTSLHAGPFLIQNTWNPHTEATRIFRMLPWFCASMYRLPWSIVTNMSVVSCCFHAMSGQYLTLLHAEARIWTKMRAVFAPEHYLSYRSCYEGRGGA